jgi:FlaA1/EpsC-like NDP-sugar epimerase
MLSRDLDVKLARALGKGETLKPFNWGEKVEGAIVMVTGAGGFIGRDLADRLCSAMPQMIVLIDSSEYALYEADRLLRGRHPGVNIVPVLDSYGSRQVGTLVERLKPMLVIHAGAYKHVPMVERNAGQAVRNNVMEFLNLAESCAGAESNLLVISSDKAVNPSSVMGATKKLVEEIALTLCPGNTRVVRFGNVMWSSGSVLPLFMEQIGKAQPITVTDFRADRYFMTLDQASNLVLQTLGLPKKGIYTLNMGSPVNILGLVYALAGCMGKKIMDLNIMVTGLRAGEKLHEELTLGLNLESTSHPQIMLANEAAGNRNDLMRCVQGYTKSSDDMDDCFAPVVPAVRMKNNNQLATLA